MSIHHMATDRYTPRPPPTISGSSSTNTDPYAIHKMAPSFRSWERLTPYAFHDTYAPYHTSTYSQSDYPPSKYNGQHAETRRWTGRGSAQTVYQRHQDQNGYAARPAADTRGCYDWRDYRDTAAWYPSVPPAQQQRQWQQQRYAPPPQQWQYHAAETWFPGLTTWTAVNDTSQHPRSQPRLGFFDPNVAPFVPQQRQLTPSRYEQDINDADSTARDGSAVITKNKVRKVKTQEHAQLLPPSSDHIARNNASPRMKDNPRLNLIPRPLPTLTYLAYAHERPRMSESPQTLLVILDLNGTLLCRSNRTTNFTSRPYVLEFLAYLLTQHKVMVWSSARPENVHGMCAQLFTPLQHQHLTAVWGRDMLRLGSCYYAKVQVYKRLAWVWESPAIQATAIDPALPWSQGNTVLLDDSLEKAASEPFNLIELDEFEKRPEQMCQDVLGQVALYLETLRWQENVSAYMRETPFRYDQRGKGVQWDLLV